MQEFWWILTNLRLIDLVDIFIVALLFFGASFIFRGKQTVSLVRGMFVVVIGLVLLVGLLRLQALGWLLSNGITLLAVAIPVIFQQELRRALERIGQGTLFFNKPTPQDVSTQLIDEICKAAEKLSERRHGALIVLQRRSSLEEFSRTGVTIDSRVTSQLLLTVFWPKTELHDGAVIIDTTGRLAAAAAVLPLTASRNLPHPKMGTRHRAALGISEVSDAVCVVVSEETGKIAVTNDGRMVSRLDHERLRIVLQAFYTSDTELPKSLWARLRERVRRLSSQVEPQQG